MSGAVPWRGRLVGKKPRLLVFTQWFAPGYRAGGPIRSTTNLVGLLEDRFDIHVVTSDRDFGSAEPYPGLTADQWLPHGAASRVMYLSPARQTRARMRALMAEVNAECTYLNSMFSPRFTLLPLSCARWRAAGGRLVVAPRGELLDGALQYKRLKKVACLTAMRATGTLRGVTFHATDDQEQRAILARLRVNPARIHVLPNVPEPPVREVTPLVKRPGAVSLLFLSRVAPKKNLLFLLDCLRTVPETVVTRLTIAGPTEDPAYWEQCSNRIAALPAHVVVTVTGAVSHDRVRTAMAAHHCYVLPTFGENYGHAIAEALGTGRPVLISDQTPWRGLEAAGAGWDLPLSDPGAFRDAIVTLAGMDQPAFDALAGSALSYARTRIRASTLTEDYATLFGHDMPPTSQPGSP